VNDVPEADGSDILALTDNDDMGEKFLTVKRVKRQIVEAAADQSIEKKSSEPASGDRQGESAPELPPLEFESVTISQEAAPQEEASEDQELSAESAEEQQVAAEDDTDTPLNLSEAPVPCLVAAPGSYTVANEDPVEADSATTAEQDEVQATVAEYVADNQPPADDEAFDQYLLQGEKLQAQEQDPEELAVEATEGVVSVDPSEGTFIDYHEDFLSMEGLDRSSISSVAGVISQAMEEVAERARETLRERGQAAESLEVDVMLGADPASIKRCYAGGFEPVTAICGELPVALQELRQEELDTIYLRLFNGQTNENWNDLFNTEVAAGEPAPGEAAQGEPTAGDAGDEAVAVELEAEPWVDASDIDSVFDDLLEEETGCLPEAPLAPDNGEAMDTGFSEELLAGDFEVGLPADTPDLNIEDVFAAAEQQGPVADEICGVDVDEFELAADEPEEIAEEAQERVTPAVEKSPEPVAASAGNAWCVPEGIAFSYTSQSTAEIFSDFLDAFVEEGSTEVEKLEDAFGEWEKDPSDEAALVPVARILHTLKGIAKGVGLQRYGTLVHNFETLLEARPRPEAGAEADYFRMVNAWLDAVVRGLEQVQDQRCDVASEFPLQAEPARAPAEGSATPVVETTAEPEVDEVQSEAAAQEPQAEAQPATAQPAAKSPRDKKRDQKLADEGAKALAAQQTVRITAEKLDHLLNLTSQAQQLGVRCAQSTNRGKRATAELQGRLASVRTQIGAIADRALINVNASGGRKTPDLDALEMDQYSELQEAANILREGVEDLADLVELASRQNAMVDALLKQQGSVFTSITSSIQAARVVPVSRLMPGLRRIVRTVSTDLNKSVSFKVLNEVGALDRDHYARCQTILEHMVRNALDHGIESAEERLELGKPTTGRITIDVRKTGGDYIIKLADDGRGIDPDAIRESAFRKGLDIDVDKLSDDEVLRLIFHKGFSTASTLSEISGRGVGMDIVMSELQQLGGDIQIKSMVGLGTSFEIRIPANVTVNGALFVTAGDSSYAIPLNGLIAVEQVPVDEFYKAVEQGATLSLFDIECEPAYLATLCQGESLPDRSAWGITVPVIIAGSEGRYMAIAIDNVEEALELVVRSMGPQFSGVPGVAGAASTADGEAIVALDLNLLVDSVDADGLSRIAVSHPEEKNLLALVVDDSRTQRMVATSQLDTVGVETVTAENGMVAIDLLNGTHRLPDVVLLDVEMPVQDGIETLKEIRKSRRFGHLPVIMVTSRTGAKHRAMARQAGCNGYMGKPFNFPALVEKISELTGHELQLS
jgi:chemosensory pili system protein ChpA (sensor histidine kinase/response regulator)